MAILAPTAVLALSALLAPADAGAAAHDRRIAASAPLAQADASPDAEPSSETPAKAAPRAQDEVADEEAGDGGRNWLAPVAYYFSLGLDDDLEPEVEDNLIVLWILSALLPYGAAWGPFVFDEPGDGFLADIIISYAVHSLVLQLPLVLMVIPVLGWIAGPVLLVVGELVNQYYLRPISSINLYSRSLKRARANLEHPLDLERSPLPSSGAKKKKKKDRSPDADGPEAASLPPRTTTAYAY